MSVEVAVVGGGIAGMACARFLEQRGIRDVAVFESRTIASGASGRNAGFVMAVAPENVPATESSADLETARSIWRFTVENKRMLEEAIDEFELDVEYRQLGSLGLAAYPAEWEGIVASTEHARASGLEVHLVDRESLENCWIRENYYGGAWYAANAEMHPGKFVRGLAKGLSARGIRIFENCPIADLATNASDGAIRMTIGQLRVTAQHAVIATNAYTNAVVPAVGKHIRPVRGQVLATGALDRVVASCPVYANDGFQYWRQTPSGELILGGWRDLDIKTETGTAEDLNPVIQKALTEAAEGLCGGPVAVEHRWAGIMGFTPDRRPLVGLVPGSSDVAICAGFSGHGLAMAFHSAKVAVQTLFAEEVDYSLLFAPLRFASA